MNLPLASQEPQEGRSAQAAQLVTLMAVLFVVMVGFGVVIPVVGDLALKFGASPIAMGAMVAAFALAQLLCAPLFGAASDRVGRRTVLVVGIFGFAGSFLIMAFAEDFASLMAGRVLGGVLSAAALPTAQAFAADLSPPERRGQVMGRMGAAMAAGFVLGPALAAALLPLGVRVPFFFATGLGLLTGLAALVLLREPVASRVAAAPGRGAWQSLRYANRSPEAPWFWLAFVVMFGASSMFAMLVYFVEEHLGGSATDAGIAFAFFGGSSALVQAVLLEPVTRRLGEERTVRLALVVGAVGFAIFAASNRLATAYLGVIGVAAGMAFSRPTITALLSRRTALGQGVTMGLQSSFDAFGRMLGPLWAGALYALWPRAAFVSAAGVYVAGLLLTVYAARRDRAAVAPAAGS